jgi:hypothetical protein
MVQWIGTRVLKCIAQCGVWKSHISCWYMQMKIMAWQKKENQIDYQKRQKEYFDHYLLGKPAEKWITEGVPMQDKLKRDKETPAKAF